MQPNDVLIEMRGITKHFGSVVANENVNLTVRRGEILSVLGENGSGKTSLMNMLAGIYFPDAGHIYMSGQEVVIRSPKDAFALGIGMIHQHFKLVDVLTAAENIILGLPGPLKLDMKKVTKEIRDLAEKYGFELDPERKIYEMSVSQKQTVEIVKMLYRGANVLILDELGEAMRRGFVTREDVEALIAIKPATTELVLTGRGLLPLADLADMVTEMRPIKHYFDEGLLARQGIEY